VIRGFTESGNGSARDARTARIPTRRFAGLDGEIRPDYSTRPTGPRRSTYSITQLRLGTSSRGRVTLVGDPDYCPGPTVGGSTSLAVVGAFTLCSELALARGDHTAAYRVYERALGDWSARSPGAMAGSACTTP
jgi:2-polyprenyl-6-methoxyphenol hydroxylase-like FAD-dependent oxidoreductase